MWMLFIRDLNVVDVTLICQRWAHRKAEATLLSQERLRNLQNGELKKYGLKVCSLSNTGLLSELKSLEWMYVTFKYELSTE